MDMTPCRTEDEMIWRYIAEGKAYEVLKERHSIKTMLYCWSDLTGECHIFPIFTTDNIQDIANRYADLFPLECKEALKEVRAMNSNLYDWKGMSKERINMAQLRLPLTLYKAIGTLDPGFWQKMTPKGVRKLQSLFKGFTVGEH